MNHSTARTNYNRMSRFYDLFAGTSERRFTGIGLQMLAAWPGENVLEIGFGTGHSLVALMRSVGVSGKVTGVDISEGMLRMAQSRIKKAGLATQVDLRLGDAASLPFDADDFDAIFASFTLELFPSDEIPLVLAECRRVLRPGGRLGVVALAKENNRMVRLYEWFHLRWPQVVDCRPIFVRQGIETAGFQIKESVVKTMWGLPVEVVVAVKPQQVAGGTSSMDFPERTDLGNGYAWSAKLTSHDWARMFNFYFDLTIYKAGKPVALINVSTNDWLLGDLNCRYTPDEVRALVRGELHSQAKKEIPAG